MQGGACFVTDVESSNKIYGITSYIAPEILRRNKKKYKRIRYL